MLLPKTQQAMWIYGPVLKSIEWPGRTEESRKTAPAWPSIKSCSERFSMTSSWYRLLHPPPWRCQWFDDSSLSSISEGRGPSVHKRYFASGWEFLLPFTRVILYRSSIPRIMAYALHRLAALNVTPEYVAKNWRPLHQEIIEWFWRINTFWRCQRFLRDPWPPYPIPYYQPGNDDFAQLFCVCNEEHLRALLHYPDLLWLQYHRFFYSPPGNGYFILTRCRFPENIGAIPDLQ